MAFDTTDCYEVLSQGLYAGSTGEGTLTDTERYSRLLSLGLLDDFPEVIVNSGEASGGLTDVGTATRL